MEVGNRMGWEVKFFTSRISGSDVIWANNAPARHRTEARAISVACSRSRSNQKTWNRMCFFSCYLLALSFWSVMYATCTFHCQPANWIGLVCRDNNSPRISNSWCWATEKCWPLPSTIAQHVSLASVHLFWSFGLDLSVVAEANFIELVKQTVEFYRELTTNSSGMIYTSVSLRRWSAF